MNRYRRQLIFGTILLCGSTAALAGDANPPGFSRTAIADSVKITRSVPYRTYGKNRELLADIYLPTRDGPFPTILMIHGGAWFAGNKVHVSPHARYAAENGYAVVAINYRLAPIHKFPAQLEDCESALRWISLNHSKYAFDPGRIAVYGYSAGGHLACLLGLRQNDGRSCVSIRAIVAGGTPCDFDWIPEHRDTLAYWLGGSRSELPEIYEMASPISHVDPRDPPVYLFHGRADRVVPIRSPEKMVAALRKHRVMVSLHVADGGHIAAFVDLNPRKHAIEFLDKQFENAIPR